MSYDDLSKLLVGLWVLFVCSLSLKLTTTTFAVLWNTVPLISHLTALRGFGSWREKSGYRNGVSGGENWWIWLWGQGLQVVVVG